MRVRAVDLFCGAGGFSLGFKQAGWEIVAAFDNDPLAVEVYHHLVGAEAKLADVRELTAADIPDTDAIIGGPPCQPYSLAGKRLRSADPRDGLPDFLRLVLEKRPAIVVLENVPLLESAPEFARVVESLQGAGYAVDWRILNAADYGVPQTRQRLFLIALWDEKRVPARTWPFPTHSRYVGLFTERWISAGSVLLPLLEMRKPDADRLPRWIESRWWQVPDHLRDEVLIHQQLTTKNGKRDYLDVCPLALPAFTVTVSLVQRNAFVVHGGQYWRIGKREGTILQGLPFLLGMTAKHIGNAVPPLLAQRLGEALKDLDA